MTLRLFVGLPLPDEIAFDLIGLQRGIPGASWRPREAFHITLRFVGAVDEGQTRALDDALGAIDMAPIDLRLRGAGAFGGADPHAVWLGVEASDALTLLAERCERACRKIGLAPEKRKWTPHVTMAYLNSGVDVARVALFVTNNATFASERFVADRFHLYSSWLGKGPSRYVAEAEYPLSAPRKNI